ncbi:MAG: hypothetical protein K9H64_11690 [Bacteroidales bacterium]|nr:hypothetical protein [Bacteroidales bacterium]MCF8456674.1 hypothetical protein [Bacteroidales bacterium]
MEVHETGRFKSYGAFMKDNVLVSEKLYDDLELLSSLLNDSFHYAMSLPPK